MKIDKNVLHYYIDLLRTRNVEERNWSETDSCVNALYNAIRTMKILLLLLAMIQTVV